MAISIDQYPNSEVMPVGQDIIFAVSDAATLVSHVNVKYYCDVMFSIVSDASLVKIATLKVSPNAAGSGIFNIRRMIESQLGADYNIDSVNLNVKFKGEAGVEGAPIHYVAQYSTSNNISGSFECNFYVKASTDYREPVSVVGATVTSDNFFVTNTAPDHSDILINTAGLYHYDNDVLGLFQNSATAEFLSGMPDVIYARDNDVGVVGLTQSLGSYDTPYTGIYGLEFKFYNSAGGELSTRAMQASTSAGGYGSGSSSSDTRRMNLYAGVFPGNIKQHYGYPSQTDYYTFRAVAVSGTSRTKLYTVKLIEECKNPVTRLCWLNKFGCWDYYNFTAKSTKTKDVSRKFFNASSGDWSGTQYKHTHYKGGKTVYKVESKESTLLHTEYLSESEGIWLESLMSSAEVFHIKEGSNWSLGDSAEAQTDFRDLIEPVVIKNSSITRKTVENDTLISHSFIIERSINNNTNRR